MCNIGTHTIVVLFKGAVKSVSFSSSKKNICIERTCLYKYIDIECCLAFKPNKYL